MQKGIGSYVAALATGIALSTTAQAVVVDYTTVPNGLTPSVVLGGTTVTGSGNIGSANLLGIRGLGVEGGGDNASLDIGETMTIDLGGSATNVFLTANDVNPPGNALLRFEAFAGVTSLGAFDLPTAVGPSSLYDLSAFVGGSAFTSILLTVPNSPPLGWQIMRLEFDVAAAAPLPGTLLLAALGLGALGFTRRRG